MNDRQAKIAKILDLMKLAEGNSNEAERKSALEAADRIIKKYGVEPWELSPDGLQLSGLPSLSDFLVRSFTFIAELHRFVTEMEKEHGDNTSKTK